ncbi:MAG: hypothetical protein FWG37_04500 [Clostridia bacterium]|nr:hypothetical protein [Clostridia bacterium]
MEKQLNKDCPCVSNCPRHGDCEACKANHAGSLTACQRLAKEEEKRRATA